MPQPTFRRAALAGALLGCLLSAAVQAQEPFREEKGFLRIKLAGRDVRLETLVVRPDTAQERLPLALITHGKSASSFTMGDLSAANYATVARDFARRGWLAVVVVRRGFGQSDGPFPAGPSCDTLNFKGRFETDADELDAALRSLQERPDVDPQRVVAVGESAGGAAVMALARRKPAGLRGVVNVAGGLNLEECTDKARDALVEAVRSWQAPDAAPQLWIYAKNDELFPPALVDRMRAAGLDAGGNIRFIELPEIKPTGHFIFRHGQARHAWLREMDTSLRAWQLPSWSPDRAREFYGKLGLTTRADTFERYFAAPGDKAMAISRATKAFRYWYGSNTLDVAKTGAMRDCEKAATDCVLAFENDRFLLTP